MYGAYSPRAYTGDYKAFGLRGFDWRIFEDQRARGIIAAPYGGSAASIPWRGFGRRIFEDWRAGGVTTALTCAAPS
jgi:hypothetical protein